ncbi:MAG TPA: periplasmic heavy metal sensor [Hyphomicrobiaceae bacterium]|nr:periplasmic heavy metal sensor [Hyphomicrobiaceae bacterium]
MMGFTLSRRRALGGLLLASLCLNVLLGAFVATRWLEGLRAPLAAVSPPQLMEMLARRLPSADADILRRVFRQRQAEFAAGQADYQAALAATAQLVARPQLDADALRKAVREARDKRMKMGDLAVEVLLEALPQMSLEGRRGLLARLRPRDERL